MSAVAVAVAVSPAPSWPVERAGDFEGACASPSPLVEGEALDSGVGGVWTGVAVRSEFFCLVSTDLGVRAGAGAPAEPSGVIGLAAAEGRAKRRGMAGMMRGAGRRALAVVVSAPCGGAMVGWWSRFTYLPAARGGTAQSKNRWRISGSKIIVRDCKLAQLSWSARVSEKGRKGAGGRGTGG